MQLTRVTNLDVMSLHIMYPQELVEQSPQFYCTLEINTKSTSSSSVGTKVCRTFQSS